MRAVRRLVLFGAVAAGLLGTTACASSRGDQPREEEEPTYVQVENQSTYDMTIYVLRSGQRIRLGSVTAVSTERFRIPSHVMFGLTPLRFQADPLAARGSPVSQEIVVEPGTTVRMIIPPR